MYFKYIFLYETFDIDCFFILLNIYLQVHLNKLECHEKVIVSCNLFQKVKLSYILDSLHVK